jgi:hypothetical protein
MLFRFEHKSEPLVSWPHFLRRLFLSIAVGIGLIVGSLVVGMVGFYSLEGLTWLDAYLNAAMLLSGMGPLAQPQSNGGKIFAGLYALYSGFAVLVITGIAFSPVIHRLLHTLHVDNADVDEEIASPTRKHATPKKSPN